MQFFNIFTLACAATLVSAGRKAKTPCSTSALAAVTPTFSLGGSGYNQTVAQPSTTSAAPAESTVIVPIVVTVTDCPASVISCPARTHTIYSTSTSTPAAAVTETVIPVPVNTDSTTTYTATSTTITIATVILPSTPPAAETCVASTVTLTISLPPVTVTVQSSTAALPTSSAPFPTGPISIVPIPTGTAPPSTIVLPSGTSGTIGGGSAPTGSPIATGAAGKIGSSTFGLVAAVAVAALML